jgi:hypothetical protein
MHFRTCPQVSQVKQASAHYRDEASLLAVDQGEPRVISRNGAAAPGSATLPDK